MAHTPQSPATPTPGWEVAWETLEAAWIQVRSRRGAAGIDGIGIEGFESDLSSNLSQLQADFLDGSYRPQSYRAVDVPKSGGGHRRLVIVCVRDRVAQTVAAFLLRQFIDPLLHPCSYAYRSGLGVHDALQKVTQYRDRGFTHVVCADIERFFDSVLHETLFEQLRSIPIPEPIFQFLRLTLGVNMVLPTGTLAPCEGLPQGLPVSPLLANFYLTPFDRRMIDAGFKLVRYADDLAICCPDSSSVECAVKEITAALNPLGLRLSEDKTLVTTFEAGFEFLGARFTRREVLPAVAHPYEADFTPPPQRPKRPPAQALPRSMGRTLYLQEQGSSLGRHGDRLVVSKDKRTLIDLPARHIDQIFIFGRVQITSAAMAFCLTCGVPVHLFSGRGRYYGVLRRVEKSSHLIHRAQFTKLEDSSERLAFSRAIVKTKLSNSRTFLASHARRHPEIDLSDAVEQLARSRESAELAVSLEQLRGVEGNGAAAYYRGFS